MQQYKFNSTCTSTGLEPTHNKLLLLITNKNRQGSLLPVSTSSRSLLCQRVHAVSFYYGLESSIDVHIRVFGLTYLDATS
jgi:hypothetical protein